jgi:recombination protein RecT
MTATGNALAKADNSPSNVIGQYQSDFALVLPPAFKPQTFVRLAQGALRRDKDLRAAAENNPGSLLHALLDAARLGHEPGTDEYYLIPKKRKGQPEVLGVEGYKGIAKRMLNAANVLSVVAEAVYSNDVFVWRPGAVDTQSPPRWDGPQTQPLHEADWFGDRGELKGAYAYAVLTGGAVSKVAVVGQREITAAKESSDGANSQYSPWVKHPDAMYKKTALRRLEPYVSKSSEPVAGQQERTALAAEVAQAHGHHELPPPGVDGDTGEVLEGELMDAPDDPNAHRAARPEGSK